MADIGSAYINIVPKAPGIQGNIQKLLDGASGNTGQKSGLKIGAGIVNGLKKAFVAGAVVKIIKDAFSAGADLQQSFGGLDTLYGDAAAAAKEYAFAAAQAGVSANSYAEQAVSFGAALKSAYGGDTAAAMQAANTAILDMADNAAKMGTPLESIQQAYQGFARGQYTLLDNLKLGYGGTKEEMQRLLADAQELTGVEYDINNLGDVYEAIHVIQGELGLTGVAAEEAKSTFSGSLNALRASWTNVMAALTTGEGLETSLQNLSESVSNFANNILAMLGQVAPQVPAFIMGILDAFISNAPTLVAGGAEMIAQLLVGFLNSIPQIISQVPELFNQVVAAFSTVDWASIGKSIIDGIVNGIVAAASALFNALKDLAQRALGAVEEELDINSPSKKFIPVGRALPEGMAVGVDDGAPILDRELNSLAAYSISSMKRALLPAATMPRNTAGVQSGHRDSDSQPVNVTVVLQGDAGKVFKVVKSYNDKRTRATNYNSLSRA